MTLADQFGEHTLPILVISASLAVITVTLALQWWFRRRAAHAATPEELRAWQEQAGRVLDQWMEGVERELAERWSSPFPDTVAHAEDPLELDRAAKTCPDGPLRGIIGQLRAAADDLLRTARSTGASSPETAAAEQRYEEWKAQAESRLSGAGK